MDTIIEKLKYDMDLHNLSKGAQKHYVCSVKKFQQYFNKPATELGINDIKSFLHYLKYDRKLTISTINSYRTGLRYLYEVTLGSGWSDMRIPRLRYYKKTPAVLSKEEVFQLFKATDKLKYKTMLVMMYGSGLRVGEVVALRVQDIDSNRMQVYVEEGKHGSSRHTILSQKGLELLREYVKQYFLRIGKKIKPDDWLFPGDIVGQHITTRSVQQAIKRAKRKAKISKNVTVHMLRHSFATHLLDEGANLFHIKQLLGHKSIRSTCVYLHMVDIRGSGIKSPLDEHEEVL